MTEKVYRAKVPLYESSLRIVVTDDVQAYYEKHMNRRDPVEAFTASLKGKLCIVIHENATIGTLAHEAIHGAADILRFHGSRWGKKNQEPLCYLTGWIMDWAYRVIGVSKRNAKSAKAQKLK